MGHALQVRRHQRGLRRGAVHLQHILSVHHDGSQAGDLGVPRIEDDHLWVVSLQRLRDMLVPEGIAGQVQRFFVRMLEDHAAHFTQQLTDGGDGRIGAVLARRPAQGDAFKLSRVGEKADISKPRGRHELRVCAVLHEHGQVFGKQRLGRLIPVVKVRVRHDDRVYSGQFLQWHHEPHGGVAEVTVGGALKAGVGTLFGQHGVDQEGLTSVGELQGGAADLLNVHGAPGGKRWRAAGKAQGAWVAWDVKSRGELARGGSASRGGVQLAAEQESALVTRITIQSIQNTPARCQDRAGDAVGPGQFLWGV